MYLSEVITPKNQKDADLLLDLIIELSIDPDDQVLLPKEYLTEIQKLDENLDGETFFEELSKILDISLLNDLYENLKDKYYELKQEQRITLINVHKGLSHNKKIEKNSGESNFSYIQKKEFEKNVLLKQKAEKKLKRIDKAILKCDEKPSYKGGFFVQQNLKAVISKEITYLDKKIALEKSRKTLKEDLPYFQEAAKEVGDFIKKLPAMNNKANTHVDDAIFEFEF